MRSSLHDYRGESAVQTHPIDRKYTKWRNSSRRLMRIMLSSELWSWTGHLEKGEPGEPRALCSKRPPEYQTSLKCVNYRNGDAIFMAA